MRNFFFFFLILLGCSFSTQAQEQTEFNQIAETVQLYFDGMINRDKAKLDSAFIPEARLIGFRGEQFTITSYEDWSSATAAGQPRDPGSYQNTIVSIRYQGSTAVAETELYWPGIYYYDYLTLVKIDGRWRIVNKSWSSRKLE
ncbi:nuclear transport factor 2 family protein [Algoriphagus namhaensis]